MALPRKLVNALKAGKYEPSAASKRAREAAARINAERRAESSSPVETARRIGNPGRSIAELQHRVIERAERLLGSREYRGRIRFNRYEVASNIGHVDNAQVLEFLATADAQTWAELAAFHNNGSSSDKSQIPVGFEALASQLGFNADDLSWWDSRGNWHNVLWYHSGG